MKHSIVARNLQTTLDLFLYHHVDQSQSKLVIARCPSGNHRSIVVVMHGDVLNPFRWLRNFSSLFPYGIPGYWPWEDGRTRRRAWRQTRGTLSGLVLEIDIGVNISVTPSGRLMMTTIWSWFLLNSQPTISYPSMGILISSFYMLYNVVIRKFIQIIQKSPLINIKSDSWKHLPQPLLLCFTQSRREHNIPLDD